MSRRRACGLDDAKAASPAQSPTSPAGSCATPFAIPRWQSSSSSSRAAGCTSWRSPSSHPRSSGTRSRTTCRAPRSGCRTRRWDTSITRTTPAWTATPLAVRSGCCGRWRSRAATGLLPFRNSPQRPRLWSGVVGIAGRIGLSARSALLGGLLFASLPLVALQAPTAYNDLVVASFLVIAAYASIGRARSELVLLALAIGLALTTKFTGILALPVLALVAGGGEPDSAVAGAGRGRTRRDRARFAVVHRQPRRNRPFRRSADERHCSGARANTDRDRPDDPAGALLPRRFLRDTRDRPVPVAALSVHHDRRDLRAPRAPRACRRSSVGNRSRPDKARPGSRRRSRLSGRSSRCPCRRRRPVPPGLARVLARRRQARLLPTLTAPGSGSCRRTRRSRGSGRWRRPS